MFLEIKGIKKSFGAGESRVDVLKGIDLEIEKGEFCVLLGPSGSGKSTLLNIIGGIDGADAGSITIQGERLEDMKEKKLSLYRRKHLGYIFQMYNLIPNLTVRENKEILKLIETVNHKYGNTIVMVTHNDAIKDMADRVVKLRDGMIRRNYQNEQKIPAADLEW
jgi:ABC-type lipoprotein export system ATPase subunit